jgi:hypothetical protein
MVTLLLVDADPYFSIYFSICGIPNHVSGDVSRLAHHDYERQDPSTTAHQSGWVRVPATG